MLGDLFSSAQVNIFSHVSLLKKHMVTLQDHDNNKGETVFTML